MSNGLSKKPNIVLICTDQHNPAVTGCYGNATVDTPNMDRLAAEGIRFNSAYCSAPMCVPSRMSFLTGLYPFNNGTLDNDGILSSKVPTFAHVAGGNGYRTVLSGRMHFRGPDQYHGFMERIEGDVSPLFYYNGHEASLDPLMPMLGNMYSEAPLLQTGAGKTYVQQFDEDVTDAACRWLDQYGKQKKQDPFLLTVGLMAPHCPYIVTPEFYDKYKDSVKFTDISEQEFVSLHPAHKDYIRTANLTDIPAENQHRAKIAYYGLVDFTDQLIGRILQKLELHQLMDDTIIVYFSDHGDLIGEHGRWHKGCFYEGAVRVPLLIRLPGAENAGKTIAGNVSLLDLYPTICDWVGTQSDHALDGNSLMPLIKGETGRERPDMVKAEHYEGVKGCRRMVKKGAWKYVFYNDYEQDELYNLDTDPNELDNLSQHPECKEIVAELKEAVFADGWNNQIMHQEQEWNRKVGFSKTVFRPYANQASHGYIKNCEGYWKRAKTEKIENYLLTV